MNIYDALEREIAKIGEMAKDFERQNEELLAKTGLKERLDTCVLPYEPVGHVSVHFFVKEPTPAVRTNDANYG